MTFAFLELTKFTKKAEECNSHLEYWCYMLRNMDGMNNIPEFLEKDPLVKSAFEEARLMGMSKTEINNYEESLKIYRDLTNVVDTAYDDGVASIKNELDKAVLRAKDADKRAEDADKRADTLLAELDKIRNQHT